MTKQPALPTPRSPVPELLRFRTREGVDVPAVTAQTMTVVDQVATRVFRLDLLQMMENAGRALSDIASTELGWRPRSRIEVLTSPRSVGQRIRDADVVIDALVGYGLEGDLRTRGWTVLDPTDRHEPELRAPSTGRQTSAVTGA